MRECFRCLGGSDDWIIWEFGKSTFVFGLCPATKDEHETFINKVSVGMRFVFLFLFGKQRLDCITQALSLIPAAAAVLRERRAQDAARFY